MKRLIIIVEGQTEEEFVNNSLGPYLIKTGISSVIAIKLRTSKTQKGGLVTYSQFKRDVENYLKQDISVIVTTLIDFFRLPKDFPQLRECLKLALVDDQLNCLETAIRRDIDNHRFIPYIQKHEFEALVFASNKGIEDFISLFPARRTQLLQEFNQVLKDYPNPENINSRPQYAPSKRLLNIFSGYDKVLHGNILIEESGIKYILEKCPRFKKWVEKLIYKCTQEH